MPFETVPVNSRPPSRGRRRACVVGAGPNGLAAAIVFARAGWSVDVLEAQATAGGGARTMELTLPGFRHDFGSAAFPLGIGSPFFSTLPLGEFGLEWIHSPHALAHPLDDGSAVVLGRGLGSSAATLGEDAKAWDALTLPFAQSWQTFASDVLRPAIDLPRDPLRYARFGIDAIASARHVARRFETVRARALFAGLAAHSFLALDEPLSAGVGMMLGIAARAVGWPIAAGGAQSLTNALVVYLESLGGKVTTSARVDDLADLGACDAIACDVSPSELARIGGARLTPRFTRAMQRYAYGSGAFKVDYALNAPVPWTARDCGDAATVHLGGTFDEIATSERAIRDGAVAEKPFVLLVQPSRFDASRAPHGKETAWAYVHVPSGSQADALPSIERQIERFAPGFASTILARRVFTPRDLEAADANLIGGDIAGGAMGLRQFFLRPTARQYATPDPRVYLCSSSTPPGAGVHGMCGYHAAKLAVARA